MSDIDKPNETVDDIIDDPTGSDGNAFETFNECDTVVQPMTPFKRGIGWGGASVLFLLASVLGAAGGWGAVNYLTPNDSDITQAPRVDLSPLTARLDKAETTLTGQGAQLKLLQSEINNRPASIEVRAKPMPTDAPLAATTRVELDAQSAETIETLRDQVDAMETALQSLRDDMVAQAAVEPTSPATASQEFVGQDLGNDERVADLVNDVETLRARIDGLEQGLGETRAMAAAPTIVKEPVLLPAFPRETVFDALTTEPQEADAGWMAKTLKKHISVRNPEDVKRAERQLDNIAEAIETGDITQAVSIVEAMPQDAQNKASDWLLAARRQN
ncbi:hypothetical protein [Fretibacter rubidus]|uniref:hypothetical protein n=1 Tax=Fretibacter rubidus TaxID=570162 RepID=UPI003529E7D1